MILQGLQSGALAFPASTSPGCAQAIYFYELSESRQRRVADGVDGSLIRAEKGGPWWVFATVNAWSRALDDADAHTFA